MMPGAIVGSRTSRTSILFYVCIALLATAYAYKTLQHPGDVQILQTRLSNNDRILELVKEKYPIVFEESVVDCAGLFRTILKYQYLFYRKSALSMAHASSWSAPCTARFNMLVVRCTTGKFAVDVRHPSHARASDAPPVTRILLRADQPLLLPSRWSYRIVQLDAAVGCNATTSVADVHRGYDVLHWLQTQVV